MKSLSFRENIMYRGRRRRGVAAVMAAVEE
jgi:hypothetical protein